MEGERREMESNESSLKGSSCSVGSKDRRVGLIFNEGMCKHFAPYEKDHPECPDRIRAIWDQLNSSGLAKRCIILDAKHAEDNQLALVHTKKHIDLIKNISSKKPMSRRKRIGARFDSIYFNKGSTEAASLAAGSVIEAADKVAKGELDSAFAIVRPPGHHAEEGEPMGFCLYNNVGIATKFILNERIELGINRILIVDWDAHHGNGTQKMFYNDPRVLFFSVHRYDQGTFYPSGNDGSCIMTGEEPGAGHNINVPWEHGQCGDADYLAVWDHILIPVAKEFNPDMIIISAGFDAAIGDPLGGCCISPYGYSIMLDKLMEFAGGKIVMALEGGYNLNSIASSARSCVEVLLRDKPPNVMLEAYPFESTWRVIQEVRRELSTYWPVLAVELPEKMTSKTSKIKILGSDTEAVTENFTLTVSEEVQTVEDVIPSFSNLTCNLYNEGFPDQHVPVGLEREHIEEVNQLPDNLCEFEVIRNRCSVNDSTMSRIKNKLRSTKLKALAAVKNTSVTSTDVAQTPTGIESPTGVGQNTVSPTRKKAPETSEPEQPVKKSKSVIKAATSDSRILLSPTRQKASETSEPEQLLESSKSVTKAATSASQNPISPTRQTSEPEHPLKRSKSVTKAATSASQTPISPTRKKTPETSEPEPVKQSKSVIESPTSVGQNTTSPTRKKAPETSEPEQPVKKSKSVIKAATSDGRIPLSPTRQKASETSEPEQPVKKSKSVIKAATSDCRILLSPTRQKASETSEPEKPLKESKSMTRAATSASQTPISPVRQTSEPEHPLKRSKSVTKAATSASQTPISPTRKKTPETSEPEQPVKKSKSSAATSDSRIPLSPTGQKAAETSEPEQPVTKSKSEIKAATSYSRILLSPTRQKASETSEPEQPLKRSKSVTKAAKSASQTPISPTRQTSEPEHPLKMSKSVTKAATSASQTPISPTRKKTPETSEPEQPVKKSKSLAVTSDSRIPLSPTRKKAPETSEPEQPIKKSKSVTKAATSDSRFPLSPTRQKASETSEPEQPVKKSKSVIKAATSDSRILLSPTRQTSEPEDPLKRLKSLTKAATSGSQTPISPTRKKAPEISEPEHPLKRFKSVTDASTVSGQTPISPTRKRTPETSEPQHPLKRSRSLIDSDKAPPSLPPSGQSREVDIHVLGSSGEATGTQGQSLPSPNPSVARPPTQDQGPFIAELHHIVKKFNSRSPLDSQSLKPSVAPPPTLDLSQFLAEIRRCLYTSDSGSSPGSLEDMAFLAFRQAAVALLGMFFVREDIKSSPERWEVANNKQAEKEAEANIEDDR